MHALLGPLVSLRNVGGLVWLPEAATCTRQRSLSRSRRRPFARWRRTCRRRGSKADQILEEIGSITGSCDASQIGKLRAMPGVADVSLDTPIDIGPPDSPAT